MPHAEIAGAGLAGLAAGIALTQRGWSARVHERSAAPRVAGSGLSFFENGLRVLEALGAYDDTVANGRWGRFKETRDAAGRTTALLPYQGRMIEVSRARLLDSLLAAARRAGVEVVTGSHVVQASDQGWLATADGVRHGADLVIAADGINSALRDRAGFRVRRWTLADGAIRMIIPPTAEEVASEDYRRNIEYWSGTRRILLAPCSDSEFYIALTALADDPAGSSLPLDKASWSRSFPTLAGLIARMDGAARWDRFEVVSVDRWSRGRLVLLGDAAHAMAPNMGQGGACAMMNALSLAVHLNGAAPSPAALQRWEAAERPLTDHTQRLSSFYSALSQWPGRLRSAVFWLAANWGPLRRATRRCATHVPTGTAA